jgi:DNA topoisomerase-1
VDESGAPRDVGSADVNAYIREVTGGDFTAKDFRTWAASVLALEALSERAFTSMTQAKREVVNAVKAVAAKLSNTPAVCRKCYIHPRVIEVYMEAGAKGLPAAGTRQGRAGLSDGEVRLLALLEQTGSKRSAPARRSPHTPVPGVALRARFPKAA